MIPMKTRNLFLTVLSLLPLSFSIVGVLVVSPVASAEKSIGSSFIDADYLSFLSGNFLKSQGTTALNQLFQNLNYNVEQLSLVSSPAVALNQVHIQIIPQNPQISNTIDGIAFQSVGNTVHINVGNISVNQTVQEIIGGVIVNIQINASCQGVTALLTDPTSIISGNLTPIEMGEFLKIQLTNPVVLLTTPQFQLSAMQCTGAQGFEQLITANIQSALTNLGQLNALIQSNVINSVQQSMNQISYKWTEPQQIFSSAYNNGTGGISAWIFPATLEALPNGAWKSYGTLRFVLPFSSNTPPLRIPLNKIDYSSLSSQNSFIISEDAITALVQNYFAPGQWSFQGIANNLSGFAKLLRSRIMQFFVWGDLRNWSQSTQFPLVASTQNVAQLAWNKNGSMTLRTTFKIDLSAELMPYVHFQIPFKSRLSMAVTGNQIVFTPSKADVDINYEFDKNYCAQSGGCCGGIAGWLVSDSMQGYLNSQVFQYPLPTMQVVGGGTVRATNVQHRADLKSFVITFGN